MISTDIATGRTKFLKMTFSALFVNFDDRPQLSHKITGSVCIS